MITKSIIDLRLLVVWVEAEGVLRFVVIVYKALNQHFCTLESTQEGFLADYKRLNFKNLKNLLKSIAENKATNHNLLRAFTRAAKRLKRLICGWNESDTVMGGPLRQFHEISPPSSATIVDSRQISIVSAASGVQLAPSDGLPMAHKNIIMILLRQSASPWECVSTEL